MNVEQYKKRFYNLMESTMGDVKPVINEIDDMVKKTFKLRIKESYKNGDTELRLSNEEDKMMNSYNLSKEKFWESFDEYFQSTGETPPTKVFIGGIEITR